MATAPLGSLGLGLHHVCSHKGCPEGRKTAQVLKGRVRAGACPALSLSSPCTWLQNGVWSPNGQRQVLDATWAQQPASCKASEDVLPRRGARGRSLSLADSLLPMEPGTPGDTDS